MKQAANTFIEKTRTDTNKNGRVVKTLKRINAECMEENGEIKNKKLTQRVSKEQ